MNICDFLQRLEKVKKYPGYWMALCPAHDDHDPSLKVSVDNGRILLTCYAGCPTEKIVQAMGLTTADLFEDASSSGTPPGIPPKWYGKTLKAFWAYRDARGKVLGYTARYENGTRKKDVIPFFNRSGGKWKAGAPPEPKPLYGLNRLSKNENSPVLIVEGEKAADAAQSLMGEDFVCVSWLGGCGQVSKADWTPLTGRSVYIWPDKDKSGLRASREAAKQLQEIASKIRIVTPPRDVKAGWDLADALNEKRGKEWVKARLDDASDYCDCQASDEDVLDLEMKERPKLDLSLFDGVLGDFLELATAKSEANPAAVLFTFLARLGVEVGAGPHFYIGDTKHHGRLAVVIVGESAKSRKGTSAKPVERLFSFNSFNSLSISPARTTSGPFSSGEGLISAVRDPIKKWDATKQEMVVVDPGVEDKRLFVLDEEFGGVLANTKREGNTLSMIIRNAWDTGDFDPLTKHDKITATGAHIGWVSHITRYELTAKLPECEGFNGFANRILWVYAERLKLVPLPEPMPEDKLKGLQKKLAEILAFWQASQEVITLEQEAKEIWSNEIYPELTLSPGRGLLGVVTNRGETQVLRLAFLFALLDREHQIKIKHLQQGLECWRYCEVSAYYIFGGQPVNPLARKLRDALIKKQEMTGTEIQSLFSRNKTKEQISEAIKELVDAGVAELVEAPTGGRPQKILRLKATYEKNEKYEKRSSRTKNTDNVAYEKNEKYEKSAPPDQDEGVEVRTATQDDGVAFQNRHKPAWNKECCGVAFQTGGNKEKKKFKPLFGEDEDMEEFIL